MASLNRTPRAAYNTPWGCFQDLLRTEGLKGITRGIGATMARETPGNALFFVVYEVQSHAGSCLCLQLSLRLYGPGRTVRPAACYACCSSCRNCLARSPPAALRS